jgi:hypothetical protein
LNRCVEWGGLYQDFKKGIPRGSSLSPLLGAFYLMELDHKMAKLDVKYFRYMEDILILATSRWKLKKAIQVLNQTINELKLEKHPEKTLIGRIERGFDFLSYHFHPTKALKVTKKTLIRIVEPATRIYEQEHGPPSGIPQLGLYVRRWVRWVEGGLRRNTNPAGLRPTI